MSERALELSGIFIYPVKSLRGISLDDAPIDNGRLAGDRNWLIVDRFGRFMHQRDYPQMTRVSATPVDGGIVVHAEGLLPFEIQRSPRSTQPDAPVVHVRLWRRRAPVTPVSEEADAWFTRA